MSFRNRHNNIFERSSQAAQPPAPSDFQEYYKTSAPPAKIEQRHMLNLRGGAGAQAAETSGHQY